MKKKIPAIAVIAAVCVTGLIAASASSFADMIVDNGTKDVSSKIADKIASTNQYIGEDAAKAIVIAKVSGAAIENITEFYLEHDDGKAEYEGKMYFENAKYEFEINAVDGTILEWEQENKKNTSPGAIDATSSATATATVTVTPGAIDAISSATGTVTPGEIDAVTGAVLDWESDSDDDDENDDSDDDDENDDSDDDDENDDSDDDD